MYAAQAKGQVFYDTEQGKWIEFITAEIVNNEWLYMIVDCAHDSRIYPALIKSFNAKCCLFAEEHISDELKAVSPFLVKVKTVDNFLGWCISEGISRHWIFFLSSPESHVSELKLHFKRFSSAYAPNGNQYLIRYYDPRVLPTLLTTFEHRDHAAFFRRCTTLWIPQKKTDDNCCLLKITKEETTLMPTIPFTNIPE